MKLLSTFPIILDQVLGYCSHHFGLAVGYFSIILDQAVGYCFHFFKSGRWSLLLLFWIRLLVSVPINLDQVVGYCSHYFGSGFWFVFPLF
jgi:uncharacterized membrane protein YczE